MASRNLPILDWLKIESSAPAKFILSGEYSVMYEKQAIASAIDLRTHVTIKPNNNGKVRLNLKDLGYVREWPTSSLTMHRLVAKYSECLEYIDTMPVKLNHLLHARFMVETPQEEPMNGDECEKKTEKKDLDKKADDAAIAFLLLYIGLGDSYCSSARSPIDVEVSSSIPVGSGLGSSSAYSVALCGALMRVFRVAAEKYIISNWAFNVDKFFHGKPSGVDNCIVSQGGHVLFQNGKIKSTGVDHKAQIKVMLVDTCISRSTKVLVESVGVKIREDPPTVNSIMNNINEMTTQIWRRINDTDFRPRSIADYLQANQELLNELGVGHYKLTEIFETAHRYGFVAKQTGAGGGGTAFVLYDETDDIGHLDGLREELQKAGFQVHDHAVGCEGLTVKLVPDPEMRFPTDS